MSNRVVKCACAVFCFFFSVFPFTKRKEQNIVFAQKTAAAVMEGKAECVMEAKSRRILYAKNAETTLPMASTTKIITAAVVLENCSDLQERICIPKQAEGIEGSSVYLKCGDFYTVEELLYGLMLRSGNDCAVALSLHTAKNQTVFAQKMTKIAEKAGAIKSCFKNPHGLPQEGHYTTARDLSLITCYAYQNPVFREIIATKYYEKRHWKNKNKMLTLYKGGIGVKTGYTKQAGRCLVSAATRENMTLICTLLNCPTTYERTIQLLDDAFFAYRNVVVLEKDATFEFEFNNQTWSGYTKESYTYPLLEEEFEWLEIKTFPIWPFQSSVDGEKIVGKFEIYLAKDLLFSGNLYKL